MKKYTIFIILCILLIILCLCYNPIKNFLSKKENMINVRSAIDNTTTSNSHNNPSPNSNSKPNPSSSSSSSSSSNPDAVSDVVGNFFSDSGAPFGVSSQVDTHNSEDLQPAGPDLKYYIVGSPQMTIDDLFLMDMYKHGNIKRVTPPPAGPLYFSNNNGRSYKNLKGIGRLVRLFKEKNNKISVACVGYDGSIKDGSTGEFIYIIKDVDGLGKDWSINRSFNSCTNSVIINRFSSNSIHGDSISDWAIVEKGINGDGVVGCFASSAVDGALYYSPLYCNKWTVVNPCQGVKGVNSMNKPAVAVDKLLIYKDYIYCRTFIKDTRGGALPGKSIRRKLLKSGNNNFGLHNVFSWPGTIGSFCIFDKYLYFINVSKITYVNPRTNTSDIYPAGCVVSFFLGGAGTDSDIKTALIRNDFSLIGFENVIDLKCIGNTLVLLVKNNNNTSIMTSTLNSQNSVTSISSAVASIHATAIPFSDIDILSIGKNWEPNN